MGNLIEQIRIDFDKTLPQAYTSCRDLVSALVHRQGVPQKAIAADMDMSPSDLSRKLSPAGDERRKFTLDDLERFMEVTGDTTPVTYLIAKYLTRADAERIEALEAELARLKGVKKK